MNLQILRIKNNYFCIVAKYIRPQQYTYVHTYVYTNIFINAINWKSRNNFGFQSGKKRETWYLFEVFSCLLCGITVCSKRKVWTMPEAEERKDEFLHARKKKKIRKFWMFHLFFFRILWWWTRFSSYSDQYFHYFTGEHKKL